MTSILAFNRDGLVDLLTNDVMYILGLVIVLAMYNNGRRAETGKNTTIMINVVLALLVLAMVGDATGVGAWLKGLVWTA